MPKLAKNMWTNSKGERKINCYLINISKELVEQAKINDEEELKLRVENEKIIIEKVKDNEKK